MSEESPEIESNQDPTEAGGSLLARLLQNRLVLLAGMFSVIGGISVVGWFLLPSEGQVATLESAIAAYENGEVTEARKIARSYIDNLRVEEPYQGTASFLLGAILFDEASQFLNPKDRQTLYQLAAKYLTTAKEKGFPPGYEVRGDYLLGISCFHANKYLKSVDVLSDVYEKYPTQQKTIEDTLADGYLKIEPSTKVELEKALYWSQVYLSREDLTPEESSRALIRIAETQYELGQLNLASETIKGILPTSPHYVDGVIIQGLINRQRYETFAREGNQSEADQALQASIELFRKAATNQLVAADSTRKASYLLSSMLRTAGDEREALEQASRTRKIYYRTHESVAAGLDEAELLQSNGQNEEAVEIYRRALRESVLTGKYENPWITPTEFRQRISKAIETWKSNNEFESAVAVSQSLQPLFPPEQALKIEADVQNQWGDHLLALAEESRFKESNELRMQARSRYRSAAKVYLSLAQQRFATGNYTDDLWTAATTFIKGQDFTKAVDILKEYQQYEVREHQPRALVARADALISLDRPADALESVNECLEFYPSDPSVYEARVLGGEAYLELGKLSEAKEILKQNLDDGQLEPRSREWQDSLFALGRVLHLEGEMFEDQARVEGALEAAEAIPREAFQLLEKSNVSYQGAIKYLFTAVRRYPDDPRSITAKYLIAECHRRSAELPKKKFRLVNIETQRIKFDKEVKDHLDAAIVIYGDLVDELTTRLENTGELHPVESKILRNCYFAQGSALFEMQRFEDAIDAYATASNRYQTEAVALEAFVQIAHCHRYLNHPAEARGTIEQAKSVLSRIPEQSNFSETSHPSRDEWQNYLDWLGSTL